MFVRKIIVILLATLFLNNLAYTRDYWGSIYVEQSTGKNGYSIDSSVEANAHQKAIQNCKKFSSKKQCTHIATWSNGCGAVAWSPKKKSARSGIADSSLQKAQNIALKRCQDIEGDSSCKIIQAFCTTWDTVEYIWW